jgi:hypothetical protein
LSNNWWMRSSGSRPRGALGEPSTVLLGEAAVPADIGHPWGRRQIHRWSVLGNEQLRHVGSVDHEEGHLQVELPGDGGRAKSHGAGQGDAGGAECQ